MTNTSDVKQIAMELCHGTREDCDAVEMHGLILNALHLAREPLVKALRDIRDHSATDAHVLKVIAGEALIA